MLSQLKFNHDNVILGFDPEFFLEKDGRIIESSLVIPEEGVSTGYAGDNKIIRDGFQAELNSSPDYCRERLRSRIYRMYQTVHELGFKVRLGHGIWIPENEFKDLTKDSLQFGCKGSMNVHNFEPIHVDAKEYMFRPLGGHIHLGFGGRTNDKLIKLLDVLVGNTAVIFDQEDNENARERRKNYGRPGEFRLKPYGLEYRTLSNFWVGHYFYLSMVFQMARTAVRVWQAGRADDVLKLVEMDDIIAAIMDNDANIAKENFYKYIKFFENIEETVYILGNDLVEPFVDMIKCGKKPENLKMYEDGNLGHAFYRGFEASLCYGNDCIK